MAEKDLHIDRLGPLGDGISENRSGKIYLDRALPGDKVRARVRRDPKGVYRGEILEVLSPSPHRRQAPCPHYEDCGNCTLQHATEEFYRAWKIKRVKDALKRQSLRPRTWLDPVLLEGANRRRATFTAQRKGRKLVLGYYRRRSRNVSRIETCAVAAPELMRVKASLERHLQNLVRTENPTDFFVQLADTGTDLVVTGPLGRQGKPRSEDLGVLETLARDCGISRISWRPNPRTRPKRLVENGPVRVRFGELQVTLPPAAFLQPTKEGENALVAAVLAGVPPGDRCADLFSGCGTFSGPLLERGKVDAFESASDAVRALSSAAAGKPLKAEVRDLFARPLLNRELARYHSVVFDPPRAGCIEQASALAASRVPVLVGVSCNPATFARDAKILVRGGYRLSSIQIVDQFLWSHHVEVVGVFHKGNTWPL